MWRSHLFDDRIQWFYVISYKHFNVYKRLTVKMFKSVYISEKIKTPRFRKNTLSKLKKKNNNDCTILLLTEYNLVQREIGFYYAVRIL